MAEALAQLIGAHALVALTILLVVIFLAIMLLWRLFEAYYRKLWALGQTMWQHIIRWQAVQWLGQRYPRLWSFLRGRLSPDSYLGLHLTVGVLISLIAYSLFDSIAEGLVEGAALTEFDTSLAMSLHQNATLDQVAAFRVITDMGDTPFLVSLGIIIGLVLIMYRRWLLLGGWIFTVITGAVLNQVLKAIFQRPRPEFANPFIVETNWSFPSGHSMASFVFYGMLAYLLVLVLSKRLEKLAVLVAVLLILLVGFSRMFLGAHYFSDVLAGYAAGAVWLTVSISGIEVARRRKRIQEAQEPVGEPTGHSLPGHSPQKNQHRQND